MIGPIELLADNVHKERVVRVGKLIHSFGPKRNREAEKKHRFDQDHGKFEVSGDTRFHTLMVGNRVPAFSKSDEHINEVAEPSDKQRGHEPMTELENMVD